MAKARIVEAVATASHAKGERSKLVEEAMSRAVHVAMASGISDPNKIKALMLAAREKAKISV